MIGCDHEWNFSDDDETAPAANVLHPADPNDDAGRPKAVDAQADPAAVDPRDITKWDVCDLASIPLSAQDFDENNITANRSYHAATLLIFMSDEMEHVHPDVSRILHAGFQKQFMHAVDAADVQRPPSVGPSAYSPEAPGGEVVSGNLRLPRGPARRGTRRKAEQSATYLPKRLGRGPGRGGAQRQGPAPPAPATPTGGPDDTENEDDRLSAAGGRQSERAKPIPGKSIFWHKIVILTYFAYFAYFAFWYK
jgi:hypothetical protein